MGVSYLRQFHMTLANGAGGSNKSVAIRPLHGFTICGESLDLEPKVARTVAQTLLDTA